MIELSRIHISHSHSVHTRLLFSPCNSVYDAEITSAWPGATQPC
jgi:hypothetical protein